MIWFYGRMKIGLRPKKILLVKTQVHNDEVVLGDEAWNNRFNRTAPFVMKFAG
jgi:hypothetical protein